MVCSTNGVKDNMPGSHAYGVVGGKVLTRADGSKLKMVKIRNPEGVETYNGPWNDKDPIWTEHDRKQLGHLSKNDGLFWMPIKSFKDDFFDLMLAMYEDWQKTVKNESWDRKALDNSWSFSNPVKQNVVVSVQTNAERSFPDGCNVSA